MSSSVKFNIGESERFIYVLTLSSSRQRPHSCNKLFRGTVNEEDRAVMNICFVMNDEYKELEKPFFDFATARGMVGIKGHRSVGGFRASCYNAQTIEGVQALVQAMKDFENEH